MQVEEVMEIQRSEGIFKEEFELDQSTIQNLAHTSAAAAETQPSQLDKGLRRKPDWMKFSETRPARNSGDLQVRLLPCTCTCCLLCLIISIARSRCAHIPCCNLEILLTTGLAHACARLSSLSCPHRCVCLILFAHRVNLLALPLCCRVLPSHLRRLVMVVPPPSCRPGCHRVPLPPWGPSSSKAGLCISPVGSSTISSSSSSMLGALCSL